MCCEACHDIAIIPASDKYIVKWSRIERNAFAEDYFMPHVA